MAGETFCLTRANPEKLPLEHAARDFFGPLPVETRGEILGIIRAAVSASYLSTISVEGNPLWQKSRPKSALGVLPLL